MENTKKDILWRLYLILAGMVIVGILIVVQIGNVQFVHGDEYRAMADSMRTKQQEIKPTRGSIYSLIFIWMRLHLMMSTSKKI